MSIIILTALLVLVTLGLLVLLFYMLVQRQGTNSTTTTTSTPSTSVKMQFKSKWHVNNRVNSAAKAKIEVSAGGNVQVSGDNRTITVDGKVAAFHPEGQIDDPILASSPGGKTILTYTVGHQKLYHTVRGADGQWTAPYLVISLPGGVQNASAYPIMYRDNHGKLFSTASSAIQPITTLEPSPLDDSEPSVLPLPSLPGVVLVVYAVKDRGLYRIRSVDAGKTWSAAHLIVADALACRPKLFATKQGIQLVYLSFLDGNKSEVYSTISTDNGISFSPVAQQVGAVTLPVANSNPLPPPALFVNPDGTELQILNQRIVLP